VVRVVPHVVDKGKLAEPALFISGHTSDLTVYTVMVEVGVEVIPEIILVVIVSYIVSFDEQGTSLIQEVLQ